MHRPSPANEEIGQGFLLTRASRDRGGSTEIEFWVATDGGPVRLLVAGERPVCFLGADRATLAKEVLRPLGETVEVSPLDLRNFAGEAMAAVYTRTMADQYTARDLLASRGIDVLEGDIRLHDRYLMERFIQGGLAFTGRSVDRGGFREVHGSRLRPADYRPSLRLLSLDIECDLDGSLWSVGLAGDGADPGEVLVIGEPEPCDHTRILWVPDEAALLVRLRDRINGIDPDLVVGWNLVNFDLRILLARAEKYRIPMTIGRGGSHARWRDARGDPGKGWVTLPGRVAIDGIDALRSATWSFPSFSLESVSRELLGRGKKVDQDADHRYEEIRQNFLHNKTALAAYNLEDCRLVLDVFSTTNIVDYLELRSQITGLELDRAGGSVAAFTNLYLPRLHRGGYVAPGLPPDGGLASPGGYVMDSAPGLYRNVLVLDFKSLYPAIIRTFKIDPMGLVEGLADPANAIEGFRGARFHRERHYLPGIITSLWRQRDQAKRDDDQPRSQAIKILMNSFYGVLGSGGCRFYDPRLASSITMRGHEIMQTTAGWIEETGFRVIYGDTDSLFVVLDDAMGPAECRDTGNALTASMNQRWRERIRGDFNLECFLELEFETHFSRFLMPTIRGSEAGSKKRYAGLVAGVGGEPDRIVFKGLENVRTDWTPLARNFQQSLYDHVFHDRDPSDLIRQTVHRTLSGDHDADLVYRKQLRRKLSEYVRNVPPHVRAARQADERNREHGRPLRYQNRGWINYVITTAGPEPVEYRQTPLDYEHYIERQLKPVADAVLPFVGLEFDAVVSRQAALF
jgi:DNA polymerase-2